MNKKKLIRKVLQYKAKAKSISEAVNNLVLRKRVHNTDFTIIANNCWGARIYQELRIKYNTPFVGLFLYAPCYIKLLSSLDYYLSSEITFVNKSKYSICNAARNNQNIYPIGLLKNDIEIHFQHYASEHEAELKWFKRLQRMNMRNLLVSFSDKDLCSEKLLEDFDKLPFKRKVCFTAKKYPHIKSAIHLPEYNDEPCIGDIYTDHHIYKKHFDVANWLNGGTGGKEDIKNTPIKEPIQKICCCFYMALGNRFIDRLFWQAVEVSSEDLQNLICMLRHYQIEALCCLESRIDNDVLYDLRNKLNQLISYFRRKSNAISRTSAHFEDVEIHASPGSFPHSISLYKPVKSQLKKYPAISIVTPNYNQGKFLEKCIQSVLSQNYPCLEYIIIDGGSTDNSVEIIKQYENKIKYWVSEKDNGQADAINKGLKHATGEIFNWLNSDDYLETGALLKCAEAYERKPSAVGWVGGCRRIDSKGRILTVIYPNGMDRENIGQNWSGRQFYQPSCFLSTKRVKEVGGLNPDLYIALDLDLWIRILENGTFLAEKGIWSNAIIHADAKTQERERVLLETVDIQRKHGFLDGASIRYKCALKKGEFQYVPPTLLKNRAKWMKNSSKIGTGIFEKPVTITFISDILPCYNKISSLHRLLTILQTLFTNKCTINYIYISNDKFHEKCLNVFKEDINLYHVSSNYEDCERIISENKTEYVWIATSNDINYIKLTSRIAERLKAKKDSSKILIDATPLHSEGYFKNDEFGTSRHGFVDETEYLKNIKMLFEIADKLIVSNPRKKRDIEENIGIKKEIGIIPNVYEILATGLPYDKRRHICFIANFNINYDIDAARYFIDNIFAFILRKNPLVEFHIVGSDSARSRKEFKLPNVKTIGNVRNLERLLENYRLCVFPVAYRAGVNDRIGIAAGAGLPVVTTSNGAEGYPVSDGEECFIADSPLEFAEKCNQCMSDSITWHNFRMKSQLMIAENYSPAGIARKLAKVFQDR